MDRRIDFAISLGVIVLGVFVFVTSFIAKQPTVQFDPIGPFGFARVVAITFIVLGTILLVRQVLAYRAKLPPEAVARGAEDEEGYPASARRAGAIMVATFAYPILLAPLGYVITTIAYVIGGMALLRERSWKLIVPVALIYAFVTFYIFGVFLRVPLPLGPLTDLFVSLGIVDRVR